MTTEDEVRAALVTANRTRSLTIWREVCLERERAHLKHGATSLEAADPLDPTGLRRDVLVEEIGEVAREFNEARHEGRQVDVARLRKELIQVAATAGAWADALALPCPTCSGPIRETVGMVCPTCGVDYG